MGKFHGEKRELRDKIKELQPIVDDHNVMMELAKNNLKAADEKI